MHSDTGISSTAMSTLNSFVNDSAASGDNVRAAGLVSLVLLPHILQQLLHCADLLADGQPLDRLGILLRRVLRALCRRLSLTLHPRVKCFTTPCSAHCLQRTTRTMPGIRG